MKTGLLCLFVMFIQWRTSELSAQYSHNDWSVYFGGINNEYVEEVVTDPSGNIVIAGKTKSSSGIATTGAHQSKFGGGASDAFVAKYDSGGNLLWSGYLGGTLTEYAYAVSTDVNGNIYIGGKTNSTNNISTAGSYQPAFGGGGNDGFISKFSPQGNLLWSTYFGGKNGDWVLTLANDAAGNVYAAGFTGSTKSIATTGAHQTTYAGNMDCYLAKFSTDGQLLWSTYFGSAGEDRPHDLQVDHDGNVIMSGTTPGGSGMTTTGAYQKSSGGKLDAFLSKWTSDGSLLWCTFYGGSEDDRSRECAIDDENNIYMTGFTMSPDKIATPLSHQAELSPPASGTDHNFDAYLVKFSPDGELDWGTYFGGSKDEFGRGACFTPEGNLIISGVTASTSNIGSADAFQSSKKGVTDAYIAAFAKDGSFIGGTYFGGTGSEPYDIGYGPAVATDASGNIYVAPSTNSPDIPNAKNAFHPGTADNMYDGVLTHFSASSPKLFADQIFDMNMQVYPNPANGEATISLSSQKEDQVTVEVSDLTGKIVAAFPFTVMTGVNEKKINVKSIPAGTYLITIPEIANTRALPFVVTR